MRNLQNFGPGVFGILSIVAAFLLAIVLFNNLPRFFDFLQGTSNAPLFYYSLIALAGILVVLQPNSLPAFVKTPIFIWSLFMLGMFTLNIIRLSTGNFSNDALDTEIDQIQRLVLLPTIAYLAFVSDKKWFRMLLPIGCLFAIGSILTDFLFPELYATAQAEGANSVRAFGFYQDPNAAAEVAILSCVLLQGFMKNRFMVGLFVMAAGIAVLVTFSRSGMLMYVIVVLIMFLTGRLKSYFLLAPLAVAIMFGALTTNVERFLSSVPEYEQSVDRLMDRMTFFTREVDDVSGDTTDDSRAELARETLSGIGERPTLGHGIQFISQNFGERPHNTLLSLWYIYGIAGVIMGLGIVYVLWLGDPAAPMFFRLGALCLLFFFMFSHNILEYVHWYAFIGMYLFVTSSGGKTWMFNQGLQSDSDGTYGKKRRRRRRSKPGF